MSTTYKKKDLVKLVSKRTGINKKTTKLFIDAILFSIADLLAEMGDGDRLEIRGFGIFKKYYFFPKGKFHNPRTGEKITPLSRMKIQWKPSKLITKRIFR